MLKGSTCAAMFCWLPYREKLLSCHVLNEHRPKVCKGWASRRGDGDGERIGEVCSVPDYASSRDLQHSLSLKQCFFNIELKANEIILSDYKYINYTNY